MHTTAIYGPPGTGKSTHLAKVVAEISATTPDVAVVSFTKAAAGVLTARCSQGVGYVGTLHALAFKTLNLTKTQVADERKFAAWYGTDIDEVRMAMSVYRYAFHNEVDYPFAYSILNPILPYLRLEHLIQSYLNWKAAYQYIDFDDMITMATGQVEPRSVVIVDEAQDCTDKQWELVRSMVKSDGKLIIAGDDDQAVFTWSGANPHAMDQLADERLVLSQSHRVPFAVHGVAQRTARQIKARVDKEYSPTPVVGVVEVATYYEPMCYPERHTVLCRDQWALAEVEEVLIERGLPYTRNGEPAMFDRARCRAARAVALEDYPTIKRLAKYLRTEYQADHPAAVRAGWRRAVDPGRWHKEAAYLSLVDPCAEPLIHLSTIHGFKGEEDDHIVLVADCTGVVQAAMDHQESYENEVRVWYVGLTRCRHRLTIVGHNQFISY